MEDLKWLFKKYGILFAVLLLVMILICIMYNRQEEHIPETDSSSETDLRKRKAMNYQKKNAGRKGYDLPIEEEKKEEAETDCFVIMG